MSAEKIRLKPCPFCGGEAKMKHGFPGHQQRGRQTRKGNNQEGGVTSK